MSPTAKFDVASLDVNVSARVPSLDVSPSLTSAAVTVIVGATFSVKVAVLFDCDVEAAFAATS